MTLAILLVLLFGQVFGLPFSHQTHLKLNLACTGCHSSAASSTKLADNNLPQPAVCLGCHKEARIKPASVTNLARFNHKLHVGMGNIAPVIAAAIDHKTYLGDGSQIRAMLNTGNACGACHRGLEQSTEVSKAAYPAMADCLVCHNRIDPPFSCEQCHDEPKKLKPDYHTTDFLDSHHRKNAAIDRSTCAGCHGRKFTCLGCH